MKKRILFAGLLLLLTLSTFAATPVTSGKTNAQKIVEAIHNPKTDYVVVVSHRGDWRDYPENSIPAIESIIRMGVDVMELDLKLTADSVLVLCHDGTIDRTTTGKGRVSDVTYDYIKNCFLKTGHNCPTKYKMPTLKEALAVCKDRIVVNIDQGYQYYDLVMAITEELGVTEQILIKGKKPVDFVDAQAKKYKGTEYRWGGKSGRGIDCSGLVSSAYMQCGVLIYRDAKIVEGWPMHEVAFEDKKPGDALFFPGHVALYLGEGRYIHSTGAAVSGGVVINSLEPEDPLYRDDLVKSLYAVGSVF